MRTRPAPVQRSIPQLAEQIATRLYGERNKTLYLEIKPLLQAIVDLSIMDELALLQLSARPTLHVALQAIPGEDPNTLN